MNKLPTLYAQAATGAVNQWTCWTEGDEVVVEWGQVGGLMQVARFKCLPKNEGRSNATTAEEQAVKEAQAKWAKQRKKKYFLSPNEAVGTLNFKPMLAHEYKKRLEAGKVTFPVDVQPKYDGVRCFAYRQGDQVLLQSRGGDPYSVAHIQAGLSEVLLEGTVLDGELYIHGMSLQNIVSLVKRPQDESAQVTYCVYDVTDKNDQSIPWKRRWSNLNRWFFGLPKQWQNLNQFISLVYTEENVETPEAVQECHDYFVAQGYEGAIIRQHHGLYRFGHRSHELLKLKSFQDAEFLIVGWTVGKGKFSDVPIFKCVTADGKEFDVAPKGTEQERARMLADADNHVGQMLTVKFFDWTDDGIPHFPVGLNIREPGT